MAPPDLRQGTTRAFCSRLSQEAGEPAFGTALEEVRLWLALEYPRAWGARALEESDLPPQVKTRLASWLEALPGTRFQFIRQKERNLAAPEEGIMFYVARAEEGDARGYRFRLEHYEELLALDVPALAAGKQKPFAEHRHDAPLVLVCTNGRRDPCCAKWGRPVYRAAAEAAPEAAWQTTHVGGHRFAPNLVGLPHGVCYGRLRPADAAPLLRAHRRGRLYHLDRYRGRTCYARPVQAADYFLREATRVLELDAFRLLRAEREDGGWTVDFATRVEGTRHRLRVAEEETGAVYPLSCGGDPKPATQYRLVDRRGLG